MDGSEIKVDKLATKCEKCNHRASSHKLTGKHECLVYHCECKWFKIPEENEVDDVDA